MRATSYPLSWPVGWKRTAAGDRKSSRFYKAAPGAWSHNWRQMSDSTEALIAELDRLGATDIVLSTNVRLKPNGLPYANEPRPQDVGAAVYFKLRKRDVVLACDKWLRVECNVYAIAKHIEALRGQERWGVGSIEQAFLGYAALPERTGPPAWEVLGVSLDATPDDVRAAYKVLVKKYHPDNPESGNAAEFEQIRVAYEQLTNGA